MRVKNIPTRSRRIFPIALASVFLAVKSVDSLPQPHILSLRGGSTAAANPRTSFVAKKNFVNTEDSLPQPSYILSRRGGGTSVAVVKPSLKVSISYYLDIACGLALTAFVVFWWKSIAASNATPQEFPYFSQSVLENGFCNKDFKGVVGKEMFTQLQCGIADFLMVGTSYLLAKSRGLEKKPMFVGSAIYTLIHGIVHFSVWLDPTISSGPVDALSLAILAVILVFCPVSLYGVLNIAPKTKDKGIALPISTLAWAGCIWAYGAVFRMKEYALTYINVVIFLFLFGSRALLIGTKTPEDIGARENFNNQSPNFWLGTFATILVVFIMCSEPFACNGYFGKAGGHLLFDVSLYTYLMSTIFG
jgi:hypothetical protein